MTRNDIDQLLRGSAPASVADDLRVQAQLDAVIAESRTAARRPRVRRLAWLAVPAVLTPVIAFSLTGGTDPRMVPDYTIPIVYTTESGQTVSCTLEFFDEESTGLEGLAYLRSQDWTGIGQRIHDEAVARIAAHDPLVFEPDVDTGEAPDAAASEWRAWNLTEADLVVGSIPDGTMPEGSGFGSNSDCAGDLS